MDYLKLVAYDSFKSIYSKQDLQSHPPLLPILFAREYNTGYNSLVPKYNPFAVCRPHTSHKISDILSANGDIYRGLFLRNEVVSIFKEFQLPGHSTFPVKYTYRGIEKDDLTFFYIYQSLVSDISFKDSQFVVLSGLKESELTREKIRVDDIEHLDKLESELKARIIPQKIILKNVGPYDLFGLFGLTFDIYISVNMYNKLKDKVSGLDVKESTFSIEFC